MAGEAIVTDGITAGVKSATETTESAMETTVGEAGAIDLEGAAKVARATSVGRRAPPRATMEAFVRVRPGRFAIASAGIGSSSKGTGDTSTVFGGAVIVPRVRASSSRWEAGVKLATTKTTSAARASPVAHPGAARRV